MADRTAGGQVVGSNIVACVLLFSALFLGPSALGGDSEKTPQPRVVSDTVALQMEADSIEKAFTNAVGKLDNQKESKSAMSSGFVWMLVGGGLLGLVVMVRYIPGLMELRDVTYQARLAAAKAAVQVMPEMAAEEKAFSAFAAAFSSGPAKASRAVADVAGISPQRSDAKAEKKEVADGLKAGSLPNAAAAKGGDATKEGASAGPLTGLRKLLDELSQVTDLAAKDDLLKRAAQETRALKSKSDSPDSVLVWKIASALEALVNQLIAKPHSVSPSTLRTATAALDLIEELSESHTRQDLVENPPIRVLAVDDDPISRHAISFTLKQALALPELASNGPAGLQLATQNGYDAIFLNIQMPEMNGFELCVKIRQTELNRNTPIVFITCHNDFNVRSKSSVAGGQDLIAKPFLTFEVALKALTLMIKHRLRNEPLPAPAEPPEAPEAQSEELVAVS